MDSAPQYDVFLSHNSKDKPGVRQLAEALKAQGVKVWFDEWSLIPGRPWQEALEEGVNSSRTAAALVGKDGLGPWEVVEMRACIDRFVRHKLPVIPVLLPGAPRKPELPSFLGQFVWVDLREGLSEDGIKRLLWGIRGVKDEGDAAASAPDAGRMPAVRSAVHNLPPRNQYFTGRVAILEKIATQLDAESGIAGLTQVHGISGLGGIGKSQTALEYAYRQLEAGCYDVAVWVRADTDGELLGGFIEAAQVLGLAGEGPQEDEAVLEAVRAWFKAHDRWLLILDNVEGDRQDAVAKYIPHGARGHVLITSRAAQLDKLGVPKPIALDKMAPDEAREFLYDRTQRDKDTEADAVDAIAKTLDYLPLALEQAAAYIIAKDCRFEVYLRSFEQHRTEFLNERPVAGNYPESVATTWSMNFKEIARKTAASADLLRFAAFLDPDRIPLELLREGAPELGQTLAKALANAGADPIVLNDVLEPLERYSLVRVDRDDDSFGIHRLVQQAVRDPLDAKTRRTWAERTVNAVNAAFPDVQFANWRVCDRLLPHAHAAIALIETHGIETAYAARLLNQTAYFLDERARYDVAEPLYRRALEIDEASYGGKHPEVAIRLNNLAALLQATNRLVEAEPLMRRALEIDEASYGSAHPNVATDLNNLAGLLQATNRLVEAEPLYRRALDIDEASYGPEHPNVAIRLNNLAQLLQATNRLVEAEPLYRRALEIDEAAYGPEHPKVAIRLNNLATLLQATNRLEEAEPLMRRVVVIFRKFGEITGHRHPHMYDAVANYFLLLGAMGLSEADARAKVMEASGLSLEEMAEAVKGKG